LTPCPLDVVAGDVRASLLETEAAVTVEELRGATEAERAISGRVCALAT